eukprot:XP_001708089.1 Hypothetical protein GL50803_31608 [Giardia lamblia ATCC 50803]
MWARLLPKSRLAPTEEPPAEEAHKASHDDNRRDGDARYSACAEAALIRASAVVSAIRLDVADDRTTITSWRSAARAVSDALDATACLCTQFACFTGVQVTARWTRAALIGLIGHGACRTSGVA